MYLNKDHRETDFWMSDIEEKVNDTSFVEVDVSDEFIDRYKEAVDLYDGIQAELELIYKSKEV